MIYYLIFGSDINSKTEVYFIDSVSDKCSVLNHIKNQFVNKKSIRIAFYFRPDTRTMSRFSSLEVSAPSKLILHGEHAVVYGKTAVAAALDLRTKMTIKPHDDKVVVMFPDLGLSRTWTLDQLR